ncbi:MarR family transcriptional regulator [Paenibacillus larvae]
MSQDYDHVKQPAKIKLSENTSKLVAQLLDTLRFMGSTFKNLQPDITLPQFQALVLIHRMGRCYVSDIANHLLITLATSTRLLDSLEQKGYIKRDRNHSGDRRYVMIYMTQQGQDMFEKLVEDHLQMMDKWFTKAFTTGEKETFILLFRKLLDARNSTVI